MEMSGQRPHFSYSASMDKRPRGLHSQSRPCSKEDILLLLKIEPQFLGYSGHDLVVLLNEISQFQFHHFINP
jgi:hypothetical protein